MADLNYTTDIAPIQNKYFDDSGMTTKLSGGEREMLMRQYEGMTTRRMEGTKAIIDARRQQAELDREQQLLLDDAQKRRRQAEVDSKLGKATRQLNRALKGESLEDKAVGILEVQSRFSELAGTNPSFQTLIDAANRKVGVLMDREYRNSVRESSGSRSTTAPKADPSKVKMWDNDFKFISGMLKVTPEAGSFGATTGAAAYEPGKLEYAKTRIAPQYGIDPTQFEDDDTFISALDQTIRNNAPAGGAAEEAEPDNPYGTSYGE